MDTKALRQKILDLAIRGKLVPQDPNDEPASVLLERIRAQKQQMVKEGKLKAKDIKNDTVIFVGEDNLHYEKMADGTVKCIEDEIPFDAPDGWEWTRIGTAFQTVTGNTPSTKDSSLYGADYPFYKPTDLDSGFYVYEASDMVSLKGYQVSRQLPEYSVLVTCIGATIGKTGFIRKAGICNQQINAILPNGFCNPEFTFFYMCSGYEQGEIISHASATTLPILNKSRFDSLLYALPPLNEQNRITARIKELLLWVESIEKDELSLQKLVGIVSRRILDLAIRGQLVPQNPDDEPAAVLLERIRAEKETLIEQGKIKRDKRESIIFRGDDNSYYERFIDGTVICVDKEVLFDLPDGWAWERLSNIAWFSGGKTPSMSHAEYWNGNVPWITSKDMKTKYITTSIVKMTEEGATTQQLYTPGTVLIVARSGILRHTLPVAILNTEATINQDIKAIELVDKSLAEYIYICLKALERYILLKFTKAGTTVENINFDEFVRIMLPIPPAEEIHRIINRLSQTDRLIDSINDYIM